MKKNITINLFGSLYAIDEDAYELLKRYEENMRSYFRRKEGGEEIADDIEYRVAELLAELKANGTEAIAIEHIEEIIRRIGNPEQMEGAEEVGAEKAGTDGEAQAPDHRGFEGMADRVRTWLRGRKLFRDTQDSMIGGVMSGLCHFFGGTDPLPWRIGMVLLCLFSFYTFAIVYLVLWAFVPQARTAEERLWMQGRPVSAESINEELIRGVGKATGDMPHATRQTPVRSFAGSLAGFVMTCIKGVLFLGGCISLFVLLLAVVALAFCTFRGGEAMTEYGIFSTETVAVWNLIPGAGWMAWMLMGSLAVAVCIALYALVRWMGHGETPLSSGRRVTLLLGWLAAVAVAFCATVYLAIQADRASDRYYEQCNTRNGSYLSHDSWDDLYGRGWEVLAAKGCHPYIDGLMRDPRTDDDRRVYEFEAQKNDGPFLFHIRRSEVVQPGLYRLEALVSGNRRGGYVYAQLPSDSARYHLAYEMREGHLPQSLLRPETPDYKTDDKDCISRWEGLEYVVSDTLRIAGGPVTYGVTNDSRVTGVDCHGSGFRLVAIGLVRLEPSGGGNSARLSSTAPARSGKKGKRKPAK